MTVRTRDDVTVDSLAEAGLLHRQAEASLAPLEAFKHTLLRTCPIGGRVRMDADACPDFQVIMPLAFH